MRGGYFGISYFFKLIFPCLIFMQKYFFSPVIWCETAAAKNKYDGPLYIDVRYR